MLLHYLKMGMPRLSCSTLLLVIAHPDDESMFFAPTLRHLIKQGVKVYILCLSNGNGAGLGLAREKELIAACKILQISSSQIFVMNEPQLQDGMTTVWPVTAVAAQVEKFLTTHACDALLTFDAHGVSGHLNHRCVHQGVKHLLQTKGAALGVKHAWQLVSERLLHKYSWVVSIPLSAVLLKTGQVLVVGGDVVTSIRAMAAHKTQWVWYRKLFVLLSSYTWVNRLQPLDSTQPSM